MVQNLEEDETVVFWVFVGPPLRVRIDFESDILGIGADLGSFTARGSSPLSALLHNGKSRWWQS